MIYPQLAKQAEITSLTSFLENPKWVAEQKLDGHRVLLVSPGKDMPPTALTRNGSLYSRKLPQAIQDFRFPPGEWVLDGELVDGVYWVFDLPRAPIITPGGNWELWRRRAALEALLGNMKHPFRLVPQARTTDEKIALADAAIKNNFEGLVMKQADAPYRSGGRTPEWLKVKFVTTADCVVTGVRNDGKDSVDLGLFGPSFSGGGIATRDLVMHDVGRASLIGKEKNGNINVGDVIEVRYLYTGANGRLYQPTIMRKRHDKRPDECTIDQLKHVNKEVLETL